MGKPDAIDRVVQGVIALVALFALFNGLYMLIDPFGWYQAVPTVKFTGPPNAHFIRDIGIAYIGSGAMLAYAAFHPAGRWLAAVAGALWLSVHGGLHIYEVLTGICSQSAFWMDAPGVLGPPLLVWIALAALFARQRIWPAGLPGNTFLSAVDRMMGKDAVYVHALAAAPGHALAKYQAFLPFGTHRHAAPANLVAMARIGAVLVEDCGPCAIISARGALYDGVGRDTVNRALSGDPEAGDLKTAFDFGRAIARQSADAAVLGEQIEATHGRDVRLELTVAAATVRVYPALKRGLGLGQSCALTPLRV